MPNDASNKTLNLATKSAADFAKSLPKYSFPEFPTYRLQKLPTFTPPTLSPEAVKALSGMADLGQCMADALGPYADIHRQMVKVVDAGAFSPELIDALKNALALSPGVLGSFEKPPALPPALLDAMQGVREANELFGRSLETQVALFRDSAFADQMRHLAKMQHEARLLNDAGFLPHPTMPPQLTEECDDDPQLLSHSIERYYSENWPQVERALTSRVEAYLVDDEAKATFREALANHRVEHFRSVVRLLFPEIERVAATLADLSESKKRRPHQLLQQLAGELRLSDIEPRGYSGFALFERLFNHLYEQVDRARMEADPVPNRNAAMHGLVIYRTRKNSLNALFFADFVFQIVHVLKSPDAPSDLNAMIKAPPTALTP